MLTAVGALLTTAAPAQAVGTARTVEGKSLTGTLVVAEDGFATITNEAGATRLEVAELTSFVRSDAKPRKVQVECRVWLRSGRELPAKKLAGRAATDGEPAVLIAQLPSGIEIELPLSTLRAIRQGGLLRPQPSLFLADLETPPANNDLIYVVRDGQAQRSAVSVSHITDKIIDFQLRGDAYDFDLNYVNEFRITAPWRFGALGTTMFKDNMYLDNTLKNG